jgi:O-antigen/teichoic acid export membrane protein
LVLFGGTSVLTQFLPKLQSAQEKANFLFSYVGISSLLAVGFLVPVLLWPEFFRFIAGEPLNETQRTALVFLAPIFFFQLFTNYSLSGLLAFRLAALLAQLQLFAMLCVLGSGWFFFPERIREQTLTLFVIAVGGVNLLGIAIALFHIAQRVGLPRARFLPPRFWRFSAQMHANSLCEFAYNNIDQIYILAQISVGRLGAYFLILQLAQLIKFVPQRVGQILLAGFSKLIAESEHERLRAVYQRLCRLTILLSTTIALGMIFLSRNIVGLFGDWLVKDHQLLILLAAGINIGCVGIVNAMLILSKEQAGAFLSNNVTLITAQLSTLFILVPDYGIYGAAWGRVAGLVVGQTGLFLILRVRMPEMRLKIPFDFWVSQVLVLGSALLVWGAQWSHPLWSLAAGAAVGLVYVVTVRLRPSELRTLLKP